MGLFRWAKRNTEAASTPFPAYSATTWLEVQGHRRTLERLARWVANGNDLEFSEHHVQGLVDFGENSPHFQAAAKGDYYAGMEYHKNAAGGKFWVCD